MKGRVLSLFIVGCMLLLGCILPSQLAPFLPFIPTITAIPSSTISGNLLPGPHTITPFLPAENTRTFTPTNTDTQTLTPTFTLSLTLTTTPTVTSTGSITKTPSITLTPTQTRTPTTSYTPSMTRTPSLTYTPTLSRTQTTTRSATNTRTASLTFTITDTPPPTATRTITFTPTTSYTPSITPTWTDTSPPTATLPSTLTFTPTTTFTATFTPTASRTFTATNVQPATSTRTPTRSLTPIAGCSPTFDSSLESQVVALLNQERANNGLPALAVQSALTAAARAHGVDMACNAFFSHTGSDGSSAWDRVVRQGYSPTWVGENIYGGMSSSPSVVVTWWMNSTPHRANILNTNYTSIGLGYVYVSGSPYQKYWVAVFARP